MVFRQSLFWDVNVDTLDPKKHSRYIVERIMDFGMDEEVRWMWKTYKKGEMFRVARDSRRLRPETKALWTLLTEKPNPSD